MAQTVSRLFWFLVGLAGIGFGGYTVYQKQYFPISHASFSTKNSTQLYIPNLQDLTKKDNGLAVVESYAGDKWTFAIDALSKQIDAVVTVNISQSKVASTISFQGISAAALEDVFGVKIPKKQNTVTINGESVFFWRNASFIVLSDSDILPVREKMTQPTLKGNADFFFTGMDGVSEAVKLTKNVKFSAYLADDVVVKGKPLNAKEILSICPLGASLVKYYASSRLLNDAKALLGVDSVNHLSWVDNQLLYMQKDSFEVLAGKQNDGVRLKNMILEAVANQSSDTAITEYLYFNNTEILVFDLNWNWQQMCGDVQKQFRYCASYNDFVFLANNLQAMYWLLKNIQLGKTYDPFQLVSKIPARVNTLTLQKTEYGTGISSKTWVSNQRCLNLSAMSNKVLRSNDNQLMAEFSHVDNSQYIMLTEFGNNKKVMVVSGKTIHAFNLNGEKEWTYETENIINLKPILTQSADKMETRIAFADGKNIKIINHKGDLVKTIEKPLPESSIAFLEYRFQSDTLLLTRTSKNLTVVRASNYSELFSFSSADKIKSVNIQANGASQVLSVFFSNDSIKCFNLNSELLIAKTSSAGLTGNILPTVLGDFSGKQNLKLLAYENDYLKIRYVSNDMSDSIKLNSEVKPDKTQWIYFNQQWMLVFEYFDRLVIYNTLGLVELEMAKPESNLVFMPSNFINNSVFVFNNTVDNKLYITDKYGDLLMNNPIDNEGQSFLCKPYLLNKAQNRIHVYKLNY